MIAESSRNLSTNAPVRHRQRGRTAAQQLGSTEPDGSGPASALVNDLDALSLVAQAGNDLDSAERQLIEALHAKGATWEQIGLALGSPERSAKQRARGRWRALGGDRCHR